MATPKKDLWSSGPGGGFDFSSLFNGGGGLAGLFQAISQLFSGLLGKGGGLLDKVLAPVNSFTGNGGFERPTSNGAPSEYSPGNPDQAVVNAPADGQFSSRQALSLAARDNAGGGYCAKGVANILLSQGYDVTRGNAHHWDKTLPQKGWVKMEGVTPQNAPEGAVLVYDSDIHRGRMPRGGGGSLYGHVELVCYNGDDRLYVSDKARANAGGSVMRNYVGAYIPAERYAAMKREEEAKNTAVADNKAQPNTPSASPAPQGPAPTTAATGSVASSVTTAAGPTSLDNAPPMGNQFASAAPGTNLVNNPAPVPVAPPPVTRPEFALNS